MTNLNTNQILLIFYSVILIAFFGASFFPIYDLWRFGHRGDRTRIVTIIYVMLSLAVIAISFFLIITNQLLSQI